MADEEQFSLCWNNFNSNLSAGFHESLCKGDLVDVTLAAEGQLVKAHRLVLSVCSPYFRKMFTQMPSNQHAFVFLKDVSHAALKDLIQFMYCGEVNVKQDALPTFISTAEALQIKGLTETGEPTTPTQTPTPASQSPLKAPTPIPTSHNIMTSSSPRSRIHHQQQQQQQQQHQQQRNQNRGSYKAESESETDDKVITSTPAGSSSTIQMVSQKRVLQRSLTPQTSSGGGSAATVAKRPKIITTTSTSSGDPLESGGETIIAQPQTTSSTTTTHIITTISDPKNVSDEPEFIELPIETIPTTKSEPDYGDEEESGEVETVDQDATYVEDDSYGDMKYDESYFTENDDAKPGASGGTGGGGGGGFSDTYTDQSVTEAQVCQKRRRGRPAKPIKKIIVRPTGEGEQAILSGESYPMNLVPAKFGGMKIIFQDNLFDFHFNRRGIQFWRCVLHTENCSARLVVHVGRIYIVSNEHNHNKVKMDKVNQEQSAAGATITSSVQITSPVAVSEQSQPIERLSNEKIQSMFTMEIERNAENSKRFDEEHVSMEKHDSGNNVETCEIINLKEDLNRRLKLLQGSKKN